ncbi:extracellular solute-binding protein [Isoptericola sp. 4D.3]|uniref:Extracellular solute-binding protein n=1 Tax=Isoptericola peretonis TaxID=2918523 RepID=A0ABT0J743_9MICO|nr:extracellular solute-binding protein [Isoptericola sp. 4D.3]
MGLRQVCLTAGALALVTGVAACSAPVQPAAEVPTSEGPPVGGFTAWSLSGGSDIVLERSFETWNSDHPDHPVEVGWLENDVYKDEIRAAIDAGTAPTLIYGWAGSDLAGYVADGDVLDLTGRVDPVLDKALPSVADNGTVDGRTYAVPANQTQPVLLYHNADVLKAAGVEPPETFDDLLDAVPVLEEAGVRPIALAGGSRWPELMYLQYLTDRIGGPEAFQQVVAGEPDAWSHPAFVEALDKIRELVDAGAFGADFTEITADSSGDVGMLSSGSAAFLLQGAWIYPDIVSARPELVAEGGIGFDPFPTVDGGAGDPENVVGNPANFWSVSAAASPADQQAAIDFLNAETYSERAVDTFLTVRTVPPVRGIDERLEESDSAEYLEAVHEMVASAPHFQLSWDQAIPPDQAGALLDHLHQVFTGELDPDGFVEAMNATL